MIFPENGWPPEFVISISHFIEARMTEQGGNKNEREIRVKSKKAKPEDGPESHPLWWAKSGLEEMQLNEIESEIQSEILSFTSNLIQLAASFNSH